MSEVNKPAIVEDDSLDLVLGGKAAGPDMRVKPEMIDMSGGAKLRVPDHSSGQVSGIRANGTSGLRPVRSRK